MLISSISQGCDTYVLSEDIKQDLVESNKSKCSQLCQDLVLYWNAVSSDVNLIYYYFVYYYCYYYYYYYYYCGINMVY